MNAVTRLEKIIGSKLWIQNNITMGRVQCAKLVKVRDEVILIICSDIINKPIWSRVKNLLYVNNGIIVLYDGQYYKDINEDEYKEYREYISEEEWDILFEEDSSVKLEEMNLISKNERFYFDIYVNEDSYYGEYDEVESKNLKEYLWYNKIVV